MNKVRAYDFIIGRLKNPLEIALAGFSHCRSDLRVARVARRPDREIDTRDSRRGDAKRHAGNLALDFRTDQPNGFGSASRGRNDVDRCGSAAFPILLAPAIDRLLRGGISMDRGHQPLLHPTPSL